MSAAGFKEMIRQKRDIIILVSMILLVLLLIVAGLKMQKNYGFRQQAEKDVEQSLEKVTFSSGQQRGEGQRQSGGSQQTAYFLEPSPEEMLKLIRESGQAQLPKDSQKFISFKIMWPCYFFQVLKEEGDSATVLLDVSEDGFGATIVTDIDIQRFPEIMFTEQGKKVWIAGEIIGVDPTGTGTIHMVSDEISFKEGMMEAVTAAEGRNKKP